MRLEQQELQLPPQPLPEPETEPESQPQSEQTAVEEEPFYRQMEIIDLVRRLGAEEEHARHPWEEYGYGLDSIADISDDDNDEDDGWSSDYASEEGCYLDGVYYVYPKAIR